MPTVRTVRTTSWFRIRPCDGSDWARAGQWTGPQVYRLKGCSVGRSALSRSWLFGILDLACNDGLSRERDFVDLGFEAGWPRCYGTTMGDIV